MSNVAYGEQCKSARAPPDYCFFALMTLMIQMSIRSKFVFAIKSHRFFFGPGPPFRAGGGGEESDGIESSDVGSGS